MGHWRRSSPPSPFRPRRPLGFPSSDSAWSRPGWGPSVRTHTPFVSSVAQPLYEGRRSADRYHPSSNPLPPPASLSRNHFLRPVAEPPTHAFEVFDAASFWFLHPLEILLGLGAGFLKIRNRDRKLSCSENWEEEKLLGKAENKAFDGRARLCVGPLKARRLR